jgi:hypothetical protein
VSVRSTDQAWSCAQAVSSTHCPIGTISPVSSASGMNRLGGTRPCSGCCQRSSASAATIRRSGIDLWLVMQDELVFLQSQVQVFFELSPVAGRLVHARGKELHVVASGRFGVIHRRVGIAHEDVDVLPVAGENGDADARGRVQSLSVDGDRVATGP